MNHYCDAPVLARYIVNKCFIENHPVSNLQLQKILFFLQTIFCKSKNGLELLFLDEFEAWPYGPVLPNVYQEFSEYGGIPIERKFITDLRFDEETSNFIDEGINILSEKSPWDLVRLSHAKESPWARVFKNGEGYKQTIPNKFIVESIAPQTR